MPARFLLTLIFFSFVYHFSSAQTYRVKWSDEVKLKKGTTDLDIIYADNSGLYFSESRVRMKSYFVIGASYGTSEKLMKFDKNYNTVFDKNYIKELKGLSFNSFQPLDDDIYLFATDYEKKTKTFLAYGSKINKADGSLASDFKKLGSFMLENKRDDYDMKMKKVNGGKNFLMVSNISDKETVSLGISLLDKDLNMTQRTVINISKNPEEFILQDVQYLAATNRILLLGKEFEEMPSKKKKKRPTYDFKQFRLVVYDFDGAKEKDIRLDAGDRYMISGGMIEQKDGGLLLAGFYCNDRVKNDLNGFFINKIDPAAEEIKQNSYREINADMLGKSFADASDEDPDDKKNKKDIRPTEDDDNEEFPNAFMIKSVDINPADNSIVITAEVSKFTYYTYTESRYNSSTKSWTYSTHHVYKYNNQDILMINADSDAKIKWINVLPKSQEEVYTYDSPGMGASYAYSSFFTSGGGIPYYSSYISLLKDNRFYIVMNDHTSNNVNAEYGDKVKKVYNFKARSNVYGISVDLATGKMNRKMIVANNSESILMPRHGYVLENGELIIPSWRMHAIGKTELKFARVSVLSK